MGNFTSMGNYTKLAALIGAHQEMALFRQFAALNVKNLLYMQAELVHLEAELENIAREDRQCGHGEKESYEASVFNLKGSNGAQWRKALEIRNMLKEYSMYKFRAFL